MAYVLFTVALALIILAGLGIVGIIFRRPFESLGELLGWATLAGLVFLTLVVFALSLIGSRGVILTVGSLVALILGIIGARKLKSTFSKSERLHRPRTWGLLVVLVLHLAITATIVHRRGIGWDGIFIWDLKARAFFVNDGRAPLDYFSDVTRNWSHQNYPLMVPMAELWAYLWIGTAHQSFGKYLILIFYLPVVPILFESARRLSGTESSAYVASLLPLAIPMLMTEEGSATSGYADFPIGAFYFAAIVALLSMVGERSSRWAAMAGLFGAGIAWTKQEGQILFIAYALISLIALRGARLPYRLIARMWLPGLTVLIGWRAFLKWTDALTADAYLPVTLATLTRNMDRVMPILQEVGREMLDWKHWSLLWITFAISLVWLSRLAGTTRTLILAGAVALPIPAYVFIYLFSTWTPFMSHVTGSLPRLLEQLSLPVILAIAIAVPRPRA